MLRDQFLFGFNAGRIWPIPGDENVKPNRKDFYLDMGGEFEVTQSGERGSHTLYDILQITDQDGKLLRRFVNRSTVPKQGDVTYPRMFERLDGPLSEKKVRFEATRCVVTPSKKFIIVCHSDFEVESGEF